MFQEGDQPSGLPGTSLTRLPRAAVLAAADARLHAGLLGNYLEVLASAADSGRRLSRAELDTFRALGQAAAESGASLPALVDLYLSATWRIWPSLPAVRQADRAARELGRVWPIGAGDPDSDSPDPGSVGAGAGSGTLRSGGSGSEGTRAEGVDSEGGGSGEIGSGGTDAWRTTGTERLAEAMRAAGERVGVTVEAVSRTRAAASAVLRASDDAVAAVCEGYEAARTARARSEEALRRELVDDLLTGTSEVGPLLERAAAFGLRLEAPHVVLVSAGSRRFLDGRAVVRSVETTLRALCPTEPLVATKDGLLVCVVPQETDLTFAALPDDSPAGDGTATPDGASTFDGAVIPDGAMTAHGRAPAPAAAVPDGVVSSGATATADGLVPATVTVSPDGLVPTDAAEADARDGSGGHSDDRIARSGVTRAGDPASVRRPPVHARPDGGSGHPKAERARPDLAPRRPASSPRGRRRLDPPGPGDAGFAPLPAFAPVDATPSTAIRAITRRLGAEPELVWRLGVSRARSGVAGVRIGYEEARNAVELAGRMGLDGQVVHADDLLIYKVLLRDREPLEELVEAVLSPLRSARGGAGPLIETLDAYFATGGIALAAARRLHLSVRALTYRLDRIHALTKHDPTSPTDRYVLQTAVLGARLIGWEQAAR